MSRRALGISALVIVVLGGVLLVQGCRDKPENPPEAIGEFDVGRVVVDSRDLDLSLLSIRGTSHADYTDWAFVFECRENRGCRAELRLEVEYTAEDETRLLSLTGVVDVDRDQAIRLARIQRPAVEIESIDRITVTVVAPYNPPSSQPTPIF